MQWTTAVQRRWTHGPTRARGPGLASSNGPNRLQLLTQDPTEHGWPTSLWTGRRVAELIRRHFAVRYHPVYVLRLLRAMGLRPQKPQLYARERDEAAIAHWRRYRWPALKKRPAGSAAGRCF
jgi:transposase